MKCGQSIEYNMKNIFLENSYTKYDGKADLRLFFLFSKHQKHHTFKQTN